MHKSISKYSLLLRAGALIVFLFALTLLSPPQTTTISLVENESPAWDNPIEKTDYTPIQEEIENYFNSFKETKTSFWQPLSPKIEVANAAIPIEDCPAEDTVECSGSNWTLYYDDRCGSVSGDCNVGCPFGGTCNTNHLIVCNCNAAPAPDPECGDGTKDTGEECDDGKSLNGVCPATCSASCTTNICGGGGGDDPDDTCTFYNDSDCIGGCKHGFALCEEGDIDCNSTDGLCMRRYTTTDGACTATGALTPDTCASWEAEGKKLTCSNIKFQTECLGVIVGSEPTCDITPSLLKVDSGNTVDLTWLSTDANDCDNTGGPWSASGKSGTTTSSALTSPTTFSMECTNALGDTGTCSANVGINAPTCSLSASPSALSAPGSSILTWVTTKNPTTCTASSVPSGVWSGSKSTAGFSENVTVTASTTFSLLCKNKGGSGLCNATVTVAGIPPSPPSCGDTSCNGTETCSTCPADCGSCLLPPSCGDTSCNGTETCSTCPADCGSCLPDPPPAQPEEGLQVVCTGAVISSVTGERVCTFCDFLRLISKIINFVIFVLAPLLAMLMIAIGGFTMIVSRGNPGQFKKGKDYIIWAFIGYGIVLLAWVIINLVLTSFGVASWVGVGSWWQLTC